MSSLHIDKMSLELFNTTLKRYYETAPSSIAELDTLRYETIPANLAEDKKAAYLLKIDVEKLVEWKLKHGTFRPTLMKLFQQNAAETVEEVTGRAFRSVDSDVVQALKILCSSLRGIGPATASLLLSVRRPDEVPFFSDELFRWSQWDAVGKKGEGEGWERKMKYNLNEYKELLKSVSALRERLGVRAVDAEKAAYVLGKEMADIDGDAHEDVEMENVQVEEKEGGGDAQEESAKRVQEALAEIRGEKARARGENGKVRKTEGKEPEMPMTEDRKKTGTKRKAKEEKPPVEGTRRSTRRKV